MLAEANLHGADKETSMVLPGNFVLLMLQIYIYINSASSTHGELCRGHNMETIEMKIYAFNRLKFKPYYLLLSALKN